MGPSQLKSEESAWETHQAQIGGKGDDGSEGGADFMDEPLEAGSVDFGKSSDPMQVPRASTLVRTA